MIAARGLDDPALYYLTDDPAQQRSHVSELIASGIEPEIDHDALARYLRDWSSWGELFRNIRPLLPGMEVEVRDGASRVTRRFPELVSTTWLEEPVEELADQLRERLLGAAAWAAGRARVVAVLVGGIDSSGVLAALAQVMPADRIRAMTFIGEPGDGDTDPDLPYVAELCRHLGIKLLTDLATPEISPVDEALVTDERPAYAPYQKREPWLRRLVDEGAEVVLTATGGDCLFGGELDELGARALRAPVASMRMLAGDFPWGGGVRQRASWALGRASRPLRRPPPLPAFYGPRLRELDIPRTTFPVTPEGRIRSWLTSPNVMTAYVHGHALTAGWPLSVRDVVLHSPLVGFLASVPLEKLNCDGRFRGLYHRAIAPWVTPGVSGRRSKSFYDPFARMSPKSRSALRDLAFGRRLDEHGYVDGAQLLAKFDAGDVNGTWGFLTAEAWLRAYA